MDETARQKQEAALKRAKEHARGGDPVALVADLYESGALDGLTRRLRRKWPVLTAAAVDQVIASSVDALNAAVSRGQVVHELLPWLMKVSHRLAWKATERGTDRHSNKPMEEPLGNAVIGRAHATGHVDTDDEEADEQRRVKQAVATARRLLPQLGQQNVQDVMRCLIDAVEAGVQDLPHRVVAETLGLNQSTVRVLMMRGLDRLSRAARAEGLVRADFELVEMSDEEAEAKTAANE